MRLIVLAVLLCLAGCSKKRADYSSNSDDKVAPTSSDDILPAVEPNREADVKRKIDAAILRIIETEPARQKAIALEERELIRGWHIYIDGDDEYSTAPLAHV